MLFFPLPQKEFPITLVVSTGAYSSGDAVSVGNEIAHAVQTPGGYGKIVKVVLSDAAKQASALKLMFFNRPNATAPTDNAAFDPLDAEIQSYFIGHINVATTDYAALSDNSVATVIPPDGFPIKAAGNVAGKLQSVWVYVVSYGTPTYAATTDLHMTITVEQS